MKAVVFAIRFCQEGEFKFLLGDESFVQTAFLILPAAAARAGGVTARLRAAGDSLVVWYRRHLSFPGLSAPQIGKLCNKRPAVGEEVFITRTQVAQARFSIRRKDEAIFRASAMTHLPDLACPAIVG